MSPVSAAPTTLCCILAFSPRNQLAVRRHDGQADLAFVGDDSATATAQLTAVFPQHTAPVEYFSAQLGDCSYRVFFSQVGARAPQPDITFQALDNLARSDASTSPALAGIVDRLDPYLIEIPYLHLGENDFIYKFRPEKERNTSIFGLIMWTGYNQAFLPYHREARRSGKSKWSMGKRIKLFVDSFVSFSFFPIRLISYLGLAVSALGFLYALFIILARLFFLRPIQGWASLMVVLLVLSGIQLLMLGIVSEYLWRTFDAARERPLFIVREVAGAAAQRSGDA